MMRTRRGVTLVELLVTLVVLGTIASVAIVAARRIQSTPDSDPATVVSESLRVTIVESRPIAFQIEVRGVLVEAMVNPDGSVAVDSAIHLEALTGRPIDAH